MENKQINTLDLSRRNLFKGAAVVAAGGAIAALSACASQDNATANQGDSVDGTATWDKETDFVIIGGGNGGLSAAAAAVEEGSSVIVLEISAHLGGGTVYSGGNIHCQGLTDYESYMAYTENLADPVLARAYVETFNNVYGPWLVDIGIPVQYTDAGGPNKDRVQYSMGNGEPGYERHHAYFAGLEQYITDRGGEILTRTRGLNLIQDDNGAIVGIQAESLTDGSRFTIKAGSTLLACGGFQANQGLTNAFMGRSSDKMRTMGTPYNTGAGLLMGLSAGALMTGDFTGFSGVWAAMTPGPYTQEVPELWEKARDGDPATLDGITGGAPSAVMWVQIYPMNPPGGIVLNLDGQRFIDEAHPVEAKYSRLPRAISHQKGGRAFLLADQAVYDSDPSSEYSCSGITANGGIVIKADSLEELADQMESTWGVRKSSLLKTLGEYNDAADAGTGTDLTVPRTVSHYNLNTPPYYAVCVVPNVYCTFGGLAINENAQVLDHMRNPIPGLYAAPPVASIFNEVYCGGIAAAGTFGYIAGKHVAKA